MKKFGSILLVLFFSLPAFLHATSPDTLPSNRTRFWIVTSGSAAIWTSSFIALNQAWYADYPHSSFHFFNDNREWMQMDKSGHLWTAYQMSRLSAEMWKWTGMNKRKAILLGGISGIAYPGIIEIQDGFSSKWGFSWGDMAANIAGAATYIAQELTLNKQRLQIKMSYWPYVYSEDLIARRNQLFGTTLPERILKDYNGQTYWISFPAKIFAAKIPDWLTLAIGYHAEGMLGGFENRWMDKNGNELNRMDIPRRRSLVLSPDIDFTKIKTNKKAVRSVLFLLNMVKVPAPAIFLSQGKIKGSLIYF